MALKVGCGSGRGIAVLGGVLGLVLVLVVAGCMQRSGSPQPGTQSHAPTAATASAPTSRARASVPAATRTQFTKSRASVPLLMFHAIGNPPPGAPYPELYTSVAAFRSDLDALAASGYEAVTLAQVWEAWHGHARLPPKPVVLTFDDGFAGDYHYALPMLAHRKWAAVLSS